MMNDWKKYKLGEVVSIKYGKDHKNLNDGPYPVYGSGGIMRYVDKYLYDKESILIPRKGSLNNIFYQDNAFWTVDTMFWSEINTVKAFPKFLFYQLSLVDFENLNVGSAVPSLTIPIINDVDVFLPSLEEQRRIAGVLSSLDDKIDLLNRENATLEALAETLFRHYFIENPNPAWKEGKMGELITVSSGKGLKRTDFVDNGFYPILGANGEIGRTNDYLIGENENALYTGRVGTLGKVFRLEDERAWLSDNTLIIKPKKYFNYVYFLLKQANLQDYDVGSTQPLIRQSDVIDIDVVIPQDDCIEKFERESMYFFEKIKLNRQQIQTIAAQRDTLLPRLMSGEVKVAGQ